MVVLVKVKNNSPTARWQTTTSSWATGFQQTVNCPPAVDPQSAERELFFSFTLVSPLEMFFALYLKFFCPKLGHFTFYDIHSNGLVMETAYQVWFSLTVSFRWTGKRWGWNQWGWCAVHWKSCSKGAYCSDHCLTTYVFANKLWMSVLLLTLMLQNVNHELQYEGIELGIVLFWFCCC